MAKFSYNSWPVLEDPPPVIWLIPDVLKLRVRPGPVAVLFMDLAQQFHEHVEPVNLKVEEKPGFDDWGWANRLVRGSTSSISCHASGTAIDLNATRHPRGVRNTFSNSQEGKLRKILARYKDDVLGRSVIRWGGDFTTTVDEMHFEINATADAVKRVADRLTAENKLEEPEMQLTDQVGLGPQQAKTLGQTSDNKASVGDLLAAAATGSVVTSQLVSEVVKSVDNLTKEQQATNALLRQLISLQTPQE